MRATILAAGGLACAGAAMTIAAFAGGGSAPSQPAPAALKAGGHSGRDVFIAQGCGSCHTFAPAGATGFLGPDLQQTLNGRSRDYVMESIVLPDKRFAEGWDGGGMMPDDFAQRIAPADLDSLVTFLKEGAG